MRVRHRIGVLLLLLTFALSAKAQGTFVNKADSGNASSSASFSTSNFNSTAGNSETCLARSTATFATASGDLTDAGGNSYFLLQAAVVDDGAGSPTVYTTAFYSLMTVSVTNNSITWEPQSGIVTSGTVTCVQYSPPAGHTFSPDSPSVVVGKSSGTNGTTATSAFFSTLVGNELILGMWATDATGDTFTAGTIGGTSATLRATNGTNGAGAVTAIESLSPSTAQTNITATGTTAGSNAWIMLTIGFRTSGTTLYPKFFLNSDVTLSQLYHYANQTHSVAASGLLAAQAIGTNGGSAIQWEDSGGNPIKWISPPLAAPVTISGTVTMNTWASDGTGTSKITVAFTIKKFTSGSESTALLTTSAYSAQLTTTEANQNWSATPTSVSFAAGDRIVVIGQITNIGGSMVSDTVNIGYAGATPNADGDLYVQFAENLTFNPEPEMVDYAQGTGSSVATSVAATFAAGPTAVGNYFIGFGTWCNVTATGSVTDTISSTYGGLANFGPVTWGTTNILQMWYAKSDFGGTVPTATIALTLAGGCAGSWGIAIEEWAGLASSAGDQSNNSTGTGTAATTNSITPTVNYSLVIGPVGGSGTNASVPAQQVAHTANPDYYDYVLETAAPSAMTATLSSSGPWVGMVGDFKAAGSSPPSASTTPSIWFLGP